MSEIVSDSIFLETAKSWFDSVYGAGSTVVEPQYQGRFSKKLVGLHYRVSDKIETSPHDVKFQVGYKGNVKNLMYGLKFVVFRNMAPEALRDISGKLSEEDLKILTMVVDAKKSALISTEISYSDEVEKKNYTLRRIKEQLSILNDLETTIRPRV